MKKYAALLLLPFIFACNEQIAEMNTSKVVNNQKSIPIPTIVYENMGDEKAYEERRDAYFELIHSGSHGADWRAINKRNFDLKSAERTTKKQNRSFEEFVEGDLSGEWRERGSIDVPGNVRIIDFHQASNDIYAVSDGGILWKGNLDGATWTPLNDDIQFSRNVIKVMDLPDGGLRIIVAQGCGLQYSDDNGMTWTNSDGLAGTNGAGINLAVLNDASETLVYLYNRYNPISGSYENKIAYSIDYGATFEFVANLASTSNVYASMDVAYEDNKAYILDNNNVLYQFEGTSLTEISSGLDLDGTNRCMIQANNTVGDLTLYALMDNSNLFKSTDDGTTFDFVSELPTGAWGVGFELANDNPDVLYYGEVNLYRSSNGGETFELVSEWWQYYDDVSTYIHADIMSIEPFVKTDGTEFTIIANHGGVNVSYDHLLTTPNIAMQDLNTGQFYDVLTHPENGAFIFGGTQDQGFQRTLTGMSPVASSFEQVISGDYGEMQFTNNAETIWIQYPGGDFQIYPDALVDDWYSYDFDVNGTDMPNVNWIVPTGAAPNPSNDFIYVGGGNLDGGSGSRLIKLAFTGSSVISSQFDFDFKSESGASISAIETTPLDENLIFVVTENGRFFHSEDSGDSFTQTEGYIGPSGGWIYTADIYASRITPGLVFVGGSGYGGASVYMSVDNANSFVPLEGDMPNTMVHEMAMDPAEKFLFAATDAGPYVYSMEREEWYDLAGLSAPLQQYISVEFVPTEHLVRFATWGRGIWDFNLLNSADIVDDNSANNFEFYGYPNPSANGNISVKCSPNMKIFLYDLNGRMVLNKTTTNSVELLNVSNLKNGTYILVGLDEGERKFFDKIVINH